MTVASCPPGLRERVFARDGYRCAAALRAVLPCVAQAIRSLIAPKEEAK